MENSRNVLVFVAAALMLLALLLDLGGPSIATRYFPLSSQSAQNLSEQMKVQLGSISDVGKRDSLIHNAGNGTTPPGLGIRYLALLDAVMLYSLFLIGMPMLLRKDLWGKIQGIITLVLSIVLLIGSIIMIIAAFVLLMVMISLFLAPPFGTIAYLVLWGSFSRGTAAALLGANLLLVLATAVCLFVASPFYFKAKGLVLALVTAIVANLLLGFLHALVPVFLVSIVDAVGAIIFGILAAIWAIFLIVGAILSIVKAIISA